MSQPNSRNQRPQNPSWQEDPESRLIRLSNRLSHVLLIKQVVETEGWAELENTMRAMLKKKRKAQSSLNWDDKPGAFLAFKERASFMAGFIQGAEYALNDVAACLREESQLRKDIKATEKLIKKPRTS